MSTRQEPQTTDYDPLEHLGCFIFTPPTSNNAQRPPKRRRTYTSNNSKKVVKENAATGRTLGANSVYETSELLFPQLFGGRESLEGVKLRWQGYNKIWEEQEKRTNDILASVNDNMLREVSGFVRRAVPGSFDGRLPTAIILVGPNIASHGLLFNQLATRIQTDERIGPMVVLSSKDATNLKGVLKKLIKDATQEDHGDDEDVGFLGGQKSQGVKLLNYDLQILQNWYQELAHEKLKVTVAIQDTEAFDSNLLSDLVSLLSSYIDRIPFVLLLGVATSIEIFHEKVPKSIIRLMRGERFDVERAEECLARIFNDAIGKQSILRLGPLLSDFLLRRQKSHTQSIQAFVATLKVAYMCHFYANPLSVILTLLDDPEGLGELLKKSEYIEAVRHLPSFWRYVEAKLKEKDTKEVRRLMVDDTHLRSVIFNSISRCRSYTINLVEAIEVLELARSFMVNQNNKLSRHELYSKALLGELEGSPLIRELLLAMKKMNSTKLITLIEKVGSCSSNLLDRLELLREKIISLIADSEKKNLNSEFDIPVVDTLRATVVSKRVHLSEKKSSLTKEETEYSKIIQEVHDVMEAYFGEHLNGLHDILLNEVFFYDLLSPHKYVFAPQSRYTLERALSRPHDYLGCSCCRDELLFSTTTPDENPGENILPSMPVTSILYKLYLESGPLINTFDLWNAFYSIIGHGGEEEEEEEGGAEEEDGKAAAGAGAAGASGSGHGGGGNGTEASTGMDKNKAQALFYRGLAEMKALGFIRSSKKKTDHLAKLAWKGL